MIGDSAGRTIKSLRPRHDRLVSIRRRFGDKPAYFGLSRGRSKALNNNELSGNVERLFTKPGDSGK